jgi:HPt (histidine-containing phosphotransfer) domain-containing protein
MHENESSLPLGSFGRDFHSKSPLHEPKAQDPAEPFDAELAALVAEFVDSLESDVHSMRAALDAGDLTQLALLAHRLKGAAGSFGFRWIGRQAAMVETRARGSDPRDDLACELAALEQLCTAARHGDAQ